MTIKMSMLILILGCAIVTFIPRVLPLIFVRRFRLPEVMLKWLTYIPICILTALMVENVILKSEDTFAIDWTVAFALVPTLLVALWTKSLAITVFIGVVTMSIIRLVL